MPDASPEFKQLLQDALAATEVGQTFTFRRTFTDGDVSMFFGVTWDYNPYHIDESFAAETWFGRRNIPGLLTASMVTHIGGMLGFLATEMQFEFSGSVFVGDTITCTVTITEKDLERRLVRGTASYTNQDRVEVLRARFGGFPSLIRLAR
jgi:acyl dehydratase